MLELQFVDLSDIRAPTPLFDFLASTRVPQPDQSSLIAHRGEASTIPGERDLSNFAVMCLDHFIFSCVKRQVLVE